MTKQTKSKICALACAIMMIGAAAMAQNSETTIDLTTLTANRNFMPNREEV